MLSTKRKVQKVMVIFLEKLDGDVVHSIKEMLPAYHSALNAADAIDMFTRDVLRRGQ